MTQISSRIIQRHDKLSNWVSNNIVLLDGELAVVDCGECTKFKIGNGLSTFNQLPFADQNLLSTKWLAAEAISQGIHAKSVPYGLAAGAYLSANASFSQVLGFGAQTAPNDQYSFVWSGDNTQAIGDYYTSHGSGSFSINPADGLSGFWIGDQNMHDILSAKLSTKSSVTFVDWED